MTAKEAIEAIDDVLSSDYHYDETLGYQLTSDDFEWLEMAKQALEKQIPKKPTDTADWKSANLTIGICRICGAGVNSDMKHCNKCGQALDWNGLVMSLA